jgi:hypothetical protein
VLWRMAIILKNNKVNVIVSSVLFVFWYHSPNFLHTQRLCIYIYLFIYLFVYLFLSLLNLKQPMTDKVHEWCNLTMWKNSICHDHSLAQWTCE